MLLFKQLASAATAVALALGWPGQRAHAADGTFHPTETVQRSAPDRDKTGTSLGGQDQQGSQTLVFPTFSSRSVLEAEGRGLEPPTGFPAPDFESGRWPIRLPSGLDSHQFIRPSYVGQ
jgi:hypothetical protein